VSKIVELVYKQHKENLSLFAVVQSAINQIKTAFERISKIEEAVNRQRSGNLLS